MLNSETPFFLVLLHMSEERKKEKKRSVAVSWCEQAEMELRGQQDVVYAEAGALVMDYEEDRSRPKR